MSLLFKTGDVEERSLILSGTYDQPVTTPPSIERMQQLFRVVNHQLHWYIDASHTAPTGTACNIDGVVVSRKWILDQLNPLPDHIVLTPSGTYRVRRMRDGQRVNIGCYQTLEAALAALKEAA